MHLFLLRHGEAEGGPIDAERALTAVGREQAGAAARALLPLEQRPQTILTSPLLRARQTAEIAGEILQIRSIVITEYLTPASDHRQLFNILNARGDDSCLVIGHEPYLSTMVSLLVTGSRTSKVEVKTGGLLYIETAGAAGRSSGILRWVLPSSTMRTPDRPDQT